MHGRAQRHLDWLPDRCRPSLRRCAKTRQQLVYFARDLLTDRISRFFSCSVQPPRCCSTGRRRQILLVEGDQLLAELLEAVKLGDLLLCLAQRGGIGKGFGHGFASDAAGEAELRIMAGVVGLGAMAGGLAAATDHGGNGAGRKSPKRQKLFQKLGSFGLQGCEIVRHKGSPFCSALVCTYIYAQNDATKKENPQQATSTSPAQRTFTPLRGVGAGVGLAMTVQRCHYVHCSQRVRLEPDR